MPLLEKLYEFIKDTSPGLAIVFSSAIAAIWAISYFFGKQKELLELQAKLSEGSAKNANEAHSLLKDRLESIEKEMNIIRNASEEKSHRIQELTEKLRLIEDRVQLIPTLPNRVAAEVALALSPEHCKDFATRLSKHIKSEDLFWRKYAAWTLSELGENLGAERTKTLLQEMLKEESTPEVKKSIEYAIKTIAVKKNI